MTEIILQGMQLMREKIKDPELKEVAKQTKGVQDTGI